MKQVNLLLEMLRRPVVWTPLIIFFLFYILHFWRTFLEPDVLYGGPGDHTAGIIWLYDQYSNSPWWQFTDKTAYPWGDELWTPVYALGQFGYIAFWLCSKLTGNSVAGYNLFTLLGFILSFVISYSFIIRRFIKKPIIASLVSLAITFTPMAFYLNAVGHTSYLFMPAYLVGVLWLILNIFEKKKAPMSSIGLGLLAGMTLLFDPYFVLFIPLAIAIFSFALIVAGYGKHFDMPLTSILKRLSISLASSLTVIIPALLYLIGQLEGVRDITGATRSGIMHDAYIYSARLADYILPPIANPFTPSVLGEFKSTTFHGQDPTFTLYIGWVLIITVLATGIWWLTHKPFSLQAKRLRIVGISSLVLAAIAFLFSLPPTFEIFSVTIYSPTWLLATLTSAWRVFARMYFIIQPALMLAVVAAVAEYIVERPHFRYLRILWVGAACLLMLLLVEYLPRNPIDGSKFWSYDSSLPSIYKDIKRSSAETVAEYPLREQPHYRGSLYLTGQRVHGKAMINGYSPTSPSAYIRMALMDLSNPQTLPVLRYLGADKIVVWNSVTSQWLPSGDSQLVLDKAERHSSQFGENETINLYSFKDETKASRYIAIIKSDYRPLDDDRLQDVHIPLESGMGIASIDLCKEALRKVCTQQRSLNYYAANFINTSTEPIDIKLRTMSGEEVRNYLLTPGINRLMIPMHSDQYTIDFDRRWDAKILINDQQIVN